MSSNKYCVIMAGGIGSRFWPKSRQSMPKQFLDVGGDGKSFIRNTFERFLDIIPIENFIVVTNRRYRELVLQHIPELKPEQVLCEPIGRNTAPCIAYAAYTLLKKNPEAEMIITPSDHYIDDEEAFRDIIKECVDFAATNGTLMTIGIRPTRPDTGYGYIQVSDNQPISRVKCFTEKPNLELAQTFVQCGEFVWNTLVFVWRVADIIEAFKEHMPEHHALFSSISESYGTEAEGEAITRVFSECRSVSIEYGIMERAENVFVGVGEFGWSDVGTWGSVHQLYRKDKYANSSNAKTLLHDTRNCVISLPKDKIAVINGLKDYIVVDTEDALLICPRSEEQSIKTYIDEVKFELGDKYI